jgi:hypothetical protein
MIDLPPALHPPPMPPHGRDPQAHSPAPGSLAHLYCDDHDQGDAEFVPVVMRACLARRALPLYWLLGRSEFFTSDRELAEAVAQARTMDDVEDAIDYYWSQPANRKWLRRVGRIRLSTQRLRSFADDYLVDEKPRPTGANAAA